MAVQLQSTRRAAARHAQREPHLSSSSGRAPGSLLALRQAAGNRALGRLLLAGTARAPLAVSEPGDPREREAERMAQDALSRTATASGPQAGREPDRSGPEPSAAADDMVRGLGPGSPLEPEARAFLEPRFGQSLGDVRVHQGASASESAQALDAQAFTLGRHIVFGAGQYAPRTDAGSHLLAHEMAHVVQQSAAGGSTPAVQRQPTPGSTLQPGGPPTQPPTAKKAPLVLDSLDLGPGEPISAENPGLAGLAEKVLAEMPQHPASYVAVTGYWDRNSVPAEDPARLDKLAKLREDARVRTELTRSALVALGLPAEKVRANSFDASVLSAPGDQNGHVLVTFFRAPLQLGLPTSAPSWPGMLGGPPSPPLSGQPPTVPPPIATPSRDNETLEAVKKGVKMALEGVGIERPHGWAKVSVTGMSVGLIGQGALKGLTTSGEVGWGGGFSMKTSYGDLHFSAALDAKEWEITLSYPSDSPAPGLPFLESIFSDAAKALTNVVRAGSGFQKLADIGPIKKQIEPDLQKIKDAVKAAQGAAGVKPGFNFGISATGPGPIPVPGVSPPEPQIRAAIIFWF